MVVDLRLHNTFEVTKDIFLDSSFDRRKRAIYLTIVFFQKIEIEYTHDRAAITSGYSPRIVSQTIKDLCNMGYLKRSRKHIDIIK